MASKAGRYYNAPTNMEEFNALYMRHQRLSGYGLETAQHLPCPFCCAPNFLVARILYTEDAYARGGTCRECGRSARAIFHPLPGGGTRFEIVQTGGPDQPEWLEPKMRRVDA